ncbi:DotH/IcmK protein [Acetobacter indonesiensis NRIC 0313]|mgnify:FL=1|uniref:Intracellular multiplication protein IcmK n=1 Tax=Acetobacter indonesiensis TaxID=104101 RepID=A0A6N3T760_9PROT|nr:DotH/IcmK family type IV secretion protein [Acetobacter indonesiensis]GAN63311.1 intracellular multiplication protein IcmK [Acetobacter indonesiensis]GBQ61912.1 DotH/IcmK protein [Acetobacter indonesiensis NRIC 0313]GEN03860.1 type IV secretion system protein IcmK [Acetobacter indonesiensis]
MKTLKTLLILPFALFPMAAHAQNVTASQSAQINGMPDQDQLARQQAEREAIPLTPEEIMRLGKRLKEVDRAQEAVQTEMATPNVRPAIRVSFQPGQQTSIIFTAKGYPTAISFVDRTGQPWPIAWNLGSMTANPSGGTNCGASANGSSEKSGSPAVETSGFYVCVPYKGSNTINIQPLSLQPRGGLLVTLKDAPKPISFLLLAGRGSYDDNLTVRVAGDGPNAKVEIDTRPGAPATGDPYLNAMLSGIAPAAAVPLSVEGVSPDDVRAWKIGNEMYLRTKLVLMTPAWDSSEHGEGGYTIYAFHETPYVLLSDSGRTVSASIREAQ